MIYNPDVLEACQSYQELKNRLPTKISQALELHSLLVRKWQQAINLVASSTLPELETRHILDSWQLNAYINPAKEVHIDLGSGAGFPAIAVALYRQEVLKSNKPSYLIELDQRKALFLKRVLRSLDLKHCHVLNERVEKVTELKADLITARAYAPLEICFESTTALRKAETSFILPKGENASQERSTAELRWSFAFESHTSLTQPSAAILLINNIAQR